MENENIERCRKFLEPEEASKVSDKQPISPRSKSSLTVSEHILLKYKRSNELRQFFEVKYQSQQKELNELTARLDAAQTEAKDRQLEVIEVTEQVAERDLNIDNLTRRL